MDEYISEIAFPDHRLKGIDELTEICMSTCRYLNSIQPITTNTPQTGHIAVVVNHMSRIFFFSDKKYYSIALPIQIETTQPDHPIFKYLDKRIDSEHWSWLLALHKNGIEIMENDENFIEFIISCEVENFKFYDLFDVFKNTDYGYLRYDIDPVAFKDSVSQGKPHHHPLHHFDIHLSNYSTFKTGLQKALTPSDFINFLDNDNERWYAIPPKDLMRKQMSGKPPKTKP